jgi:hypothetical protein
LLLVQFLFAVAVGGVMMWFVHENWFPVAASAIKHLPAQAQIRRGQLQWGGESPVMLAEGRFLAISVDLKHQGQARSPAQVAIELGEHDYKIFSLLGYERGKYPAAWQILLTPQDAGPWWGAWTPAILAGGLALVVGTMIVLWAVLACCYCGWAWLFAFFTNRSLSLAGSWRLCGAAQMAGVFFLIGSIVCYAFGWIDLIRLALAAAIHVLIGWVFLVLSLLKLPVHPEVAAAKANPFAEAKVAPPLTPPPADERTE